MSWKCDICDSYNEERSHQCYVCGQPRSAESIREGKARAKEEKIARINNGIYKNAYGISKTVFISGLTISLITIVVAIIIKIVNGQLDDIWHSLFVLALRAESNVSNIFTNNLPAAFQIIAFEPWSNLPHNSIALWETIASNLTVFSVFVVDAFSNTAKNNLSDSYIYGIRPLAENISTNLVTQGSGIGELLSRARSSLNELVQVLKGMYNSAVKHFN